MDRRIRRTRKLLGNALLELVQKKSFEQITIQDITDEADLNRATFYLHFGSKEELLSAALEEYFDALTERIEAETADTPVWESLVGMELVFEHVAEFASLYQVLMGQNGLGYVINRVIDYIATFSQQAISRVCDTAKMEVPVEIIARHFAGSLFSLLVWWLENDMPYPPKQMAEISKDLCLNGSVLKLRPYLKPTIAFS